MPKNDCNGYLVNWIEIAPEDQTKGHDLQL